MILFFIYIFIKCFPIFYTDTDLNFTLLQELLFEI